MKKKASLLILKTIHFLLVFSIWVLLGAYSLAFFVALPLSLWIGIGALIMYMSGITHIAVVMVSFVLSLIIVWHVQDKLKHAYRLLTELQLCLVDIATQADRILGSYEYYIESGTSFEDTTLSLRRNLAIEWAQPEHLSGEHNKYSDAQETTVSSAQTINSNVNQASSDKPNPREVDRIDFNDL